MIDLWYAPTPNGWKISIMLEECGLPYQVRMMDLRAGDQESEEYRRIGPAGKMPAIVDDAPAEGGAPVTVFESGAILLYLAEKAGRFLPTAGQERQTCLSWLMWQMSALGPTLGQHGHYLLYAPEHVPYALARLRAEAERLYGLLERRLGESEFIGGPDVSIADFACFPWIMTHKAQRFDLADYPAVARWYAALRARPAVQRGLALGREERLLGGERGRRVHGEEG